MRSRANYFVVTKSLDNSATHAVNDLCSSRHSTVNDNNKDSRNKSHKSDLKTIAVSGDRFMTKRRLELHTGFLCPCLQSFQSYPSSLLTFLSNLRKPSQQSLIYQRLLLSQTKSQRIFADNRSMTRHQFSSDDTLRVDNQ